MLTRCHLGSLVSPYSVATSRYFSKGQVITTGPPPPRASPGSSFSSRPAASLRRTIICCGGSLMKNVFARAASVLARASVRKGSFFDASTATK